MRQLAMLAERGMLDAMDVQLAELLARKAGARLPDVEQVRVVAATGALVSAARTRGHSCIAIDTSAGRAPWPDCDLRMPDAGTWRDVLRRSGICGDGSAVTPLVLEGDRLYLYRYHAAERRLAGAIRTRIEMAAGHPGDCEVATVALFRRLFPSTSGETVTDWQAVAAAACMRGGVTVVTGGPGTGKTTTVAKVLALLFSGRPSLRVAIAAPTGKAAARLGAAIASAAADLPPEIAALLPRDARTLHRLLGYQPWNDRFTHGPANPLGYDVVVVDEASMVDVLLMDALVASLRPTASLILLGDQDQLASVDTGYVLGDLCRGADEAGASHGERLCELYARLSGRALPVAADAPPLRDAVVRLRRSYRFESQPGIGAAAEAVCSGRSVVALDVIEDPAYPEVTRRDAVQGLTTLLSPVQSALDAYLAAGDPAQALELFSGFRMLCAVREGRFGVSGLNAALEALLRQQGVPTRSRWYAKRPVLVTANDPSTSLYNGDVGIVMHDEDGRAMVWFADGQGGVRAVAPARLPAHETAWAMTVHKAQGSEFDHVLLVLPDEPAAVLTRELLYTALTRARRRVDLVGSRAVIEAAVANPTRRESGLAARLGR